MISVIIATKDRSDQLVSCVQSILKNSYTSFEILILDQGFSNTTKIAVTNFSESKLRYYHLSRLGKSSALNYGVSKAKGDILVFTDDDCVVSRNWLASMQRAFKQYRNISMVFGKTAPFQPKNHKGQICPSTFTLNHQQIINHPYSHYSCIGYGNNMAIRRGAFNDAKKIFNEWLGPGSIGRAAEDIDVALHLLSRGRTLFYEPKAIVFHDRWMDSESLIKQLLSYACGNMACYGYYAFQKYSFAKKLAWDCLKESLLPITLLIKLWGLCIGLYYSIRDPIKNS